MLLVWNEHGLVRSFLPVEPSPLIEGTPLPLPSSLEPYATWLQAYFSGESPPSVDFPRDLTVCGGFLPVYEAARRIPPGQQRTYGQLAELCGKPGAARWVGTAMGRNPWPPYVPCHRVVAAGGKLGGFSAPGGVNTKVRLLQLEGALLPF